VGNLFQSTLIWGKMKFSDEKTILYRVDGDHHIGLGHVFRARSLCKCLKSGGFNPVILTLSPDYVVEEMNKWDVTVCEIKNPGNESINNQILLNNEKHNSGILIQDIRNTHAEDMKNLKSRNLTVINFDDLGCGREYADVLIDANLPENKNSSCDGQLRLFGKKYMVLDPSYADINKSAKNINLIPKKIIVSLGGSDPRGLTVWVIEKLAQFFRTEKPEIYIIVGKGAKNKEDIESISIQSGFSYLHNVENMAQLFSECDLAIISGGVTLYEAACCGTPSIVLPQVKHQADIARGFESEGISVCPFDEIVIDEQSFIDTLESLCSNDILRAKMSERGKNVVDGEGARRISTIINDIYTKKF